jgi:hypothetical protein
MAKIPACFTKRGKTDGRRRKSENDRRGERKTAKIS